MARLQLAHFLVSRSAPASRRQAWHFGVVEATVLLTGCSQTTHRFVTRISFMSHSVRTPTAPGDRRRDR